MYEPSNQEVAGNYRLSNASIEYLKSHGFADQEYFLKLYSDGGFDINAPDLILNPWGSTNHTVKGEKGKWRIDCVIHRGCLIELEGICVVPITRKQNKLAVTIPVSDGDECNGIVYEKLKDLTRTEQ
jgi:hypothetical protein